MNIKTSCLIVGLLLVMTSLAQNSNNYQRQYPQEYQEYMDRQMNRLKETIKSKGNQSTPNLKRNEQNKFRRVLEGNGSPMRVTFDYSRINNVDQKIKTAIVDALEISKEYIEKLLKVKPINGNIIVKNNGDNTETSFPTMGEQGFCVGLNDFPEDLGDDITTGIAESDLHIYVTVTDKDPNLLAWALGCQFQDKRATVGQINFELGWLRNNINGDHHIFEYHYETTIHELFHVLGFSINGILQFLQSDGTDGGSTYIDSIAQFVEWEAAAAGADQSILLQSPKVQEISRKHFNCPNVEGMLMENQGGGGSANSHWERTLVRNEFMTASGIQSDGVMSYFTLAFLEDSNHYTEINWDLSEEFEWGKGQGCDFIYNACKVPENNFREFPKSQGVQCSFYRQGFGVTAQGGSTDVCDVVHIAPSNDCTVVNDNLDQIQLGQKTGPTSRCFESKVVQSGLQVSGDVGLRCHTSECEQGKIKIKVGDVTVECSKENQGQDVAVEGYDNKFTCPDNVESFCNYHYPCPNYCSSKGFCLRKGATSKCHCIDGYQFEDCSKNCGTSCTKVTDCKEDEAFNADNKTCNKCHASCPNKLWCNGSGIDDCIPCNIQFMDSSSCKCIKGYAWNKSLRVCEVYSTILQCSLLLLVALIAFIL